MKNSGEWTPRQARAGDIRTRLRDRQDDHWLRVSVATGAKLKAEGFEVEYGRDADGKQIAWARRAVGDR